MSPNPLVFWNATICPYAHRTWLALEEKKLPYKTVEIDLQNKPQVMTRHRYTCVRSKLVCS